MKQEYKTLMLTLVEREIKNLTEFSFSFGEYPNIYADIMKELATLNLLKEYLESINGT